MITIRKIICKKKNGGEIEISYTSDYYLESVEGISGFESQLVINQDAQGDGGDYAGETMQPRNIIITIQIYQDLERKRTALENFFAPRSQGTFVYYGESLTRQIDYRVESINFPDSHVPYKNGIVSLICVNPYFRDVNEFSKNMAAKTPMIAVPFALPPRGAVAAVRVLQQEAPVYNSGSKETGLVITFAAKGPVSNPRLDNLTTGKYIQVNVDMVSGQQLVINTHNDQFRVELNGENISHKKDRMSTFIKLLPGENILKYSATSGLTNLDVFPRWSAEFAGV